MTNPLRQTIKHGAMTPPSARNASLDALRVLGLLGIIALHVAGGGFRGNRPLGFFVDELSRFAVPVFFLMSAYFWKEADLASPLRLTARVASPVLPAFLGIVLLTFAVRLVRNGRLSIEPSVENILLILWTGGPAFHLWFLPALVVGAAIVSVLFRYVGQVWATAIAMALFLVGTVFGAYSRLLLGDGFPFWMDRNGVFFAPIFLVAGIVLRRNSDELKAIPLPVIGLALVGFAALHIAEGYYIVGRYAVGHDYSIATLGYAVSVDMLFMRIELRSPVWSILGQATFGAYLIHLLVLEAIVNDLDLGQNSGVVIAMAFVTSLGIALIVRAARGLTLGLFARG